MNPSTASAPAEADSPARPGATEPADHADHEPAGQRAAAFLAAFNDIEDRLRDVLSAKRSDGFSWMVRLAEKKHLVSAHHSELLQEYAELRNAISHGTYDNLRPIADPLPSTVTSIEALRDIVLDPPGALAVLGTHQVQKLSGDDELADILEFIDSTGISQLPVYESGRFTGLLTTDQIARFLAHRHAGTGGLADAASATAAEILAGPSASGQRRAVFLPRAVTAQEVVDRLVAVDRDGHVPRAAVITEHGKADQTPLRIVTATDLAVLIRTLEV